MKYEVGWRSRVIRCFGCAAAFLVGAASCEAGEAADLGALGGDVVAALMLQLDADSDGSVSRLEFDEGVGEGFAEMDGNGDDKATPEELTAFGERQAAAIGAGRIVAAATALLIRTAVMTMDADGDKAVARREFTEGIGRFFTRLDADGDGRLSPVEVRASPKRLLVPSKNENP